jgi:hypothetical protein
MLDQKSERDGDPSRTRRARARVRAINRGMTWTYPAFLRASSR